MPSNYLIRLTAEERAQREGLIRTGKRAAAALIHARIVLKADVGEGGPGWDDGRITEAVGCGASTVYRVRQALVEEGLAVALLRKKPTGRQYRQLDGVQQAHWVALACGSPPDGRHRWILRLNPHFLYGFQPDFSDVSGQAGATDAQNGVALSSLLIGVRSDSIFFRSRIPDLMWAEPRCFLNRWK